jgi:hypothetical protein
MGFLRRTYSLLGLRSAVPQHSRGATSSSSNARALTCSSWPSPPRAASQPPQQQSACCCASASLTSSSQLWESAVHDFYVEYRRYSHQSSNVVPMTRAAERAMQRCLAERRAVEALEVYETLCRCGLVGIASASSSSQRAAGSAVTAGSLDQLAQQALQHVPHRKCQYAVLSLLMAAEVETPTTLANSLLYPAEEKEETKHARSTRDTETTAKEFFTYPSTFLQRSEKLNLSVAEQTRIRVQQCLHTLHATGQLQQLLGKEYCLVEMHELCTGTGTTTASSSSSFADLCSDIEVSPLCLLSRCVLEHPFAYTTPSALWAQRELLWEADMRGDSRWSSSARSLTTMTAVPTTRSTGALAPADALRLAHIDNAVSPYRSLCRNTLAFLAAFVPNWDALLVRRVAETLVLPPEAHVVFSTTYPRSRSTAAAAASARRNAQDPLLGAGEKSAEALPTSASAWTDASAHQLFDCPDATAVTTTGNSSSTREVSHASSALVSPMKRVEGILKRRVQHDVVVPDTAYLLHRFHQLRQLARHREVVVTHAVFVELVVAASRVDNPQRFHARRVLREMMCATTTALTAAAAKERIHRNEHTGRRSRHNSGSTSVSISTATSSFHRHQRAAYGFTLLGLQDELALLESCPERFYLQLYAEPNMLPSSADDLLRTSSSCRPSSSASVVLVAKQLERMIAAYDRGENFGESEKKTTATTAVDADGSNACTDGVHSTLFDVDDMVSHLLGGSTIETATQLRAGRPPTSKRSEPLFKSRSRGHWARLPTLVATTSDTTRAAAFQVGLSMYPPAGVAP